MTTEEIVDLEKLAAEMEAMTAPEPTAEERIAALEQDNAELREAVKAMMERYGVDTTEDGVSTGAKDETHFM